MFIAAADFGAIAGATSGIPHMVALVWAVFLVCPALVGLVGLLTRHAGAVLDTVSPRWTVKTARNGRLYACKPGGYGLVWARKGETADQLLARAIAADRLV